MLFKVSREEIDVIQSFFFFVFLYFFFLKLGANLRTFEKMKEEVSGIDPRRELWDKLERSYDMWASAIALREEMTQDIYRARRYERVLEWKENPISLGHTNTGPVICFVNNSISRLQPESFGGSSRWTDRFQPDPWVDQLLLSCKVRSLPFKVALSATLREALQLLPGGARPL